MDKVFWNLDVWKKAHALVLKVYDVSKTFPAFEMHGLTSQIRRAAASIPMNIAEGTGLRRPADFRRMLYIARGSLKELQYQLLLAKDLGYLEIKNYESLFADYDEIGRMLNGLIKSLDDKIMRDNK